MKLVIALVAAVAVFFGGIAWWISGADSPAKSDVLVVLSGSFSRSLYAATLYSEGYAPEVWVSQPRIGRVQKMVEDLGILYPQEPAVHTAILAKRGVPVSKIKLYGADVDSTVDEALALREQLGDTSKKILVVTSSYHVRRSRLILAHYLPHAILCVVASPYEDVDWRWWNHKELAEFSILEPFKLAYYVYQWADERLPEPAERRSRSAEAAERS